MRTLGVFAHPDDECLGAGGMLSGSPPNTVALAFLGRGMKVGKRFPQLEIAQRLWYGLRYYAVTRDQEFECIPIRSLSDFAREWIDAYEPSTVITHSLSDLNRDHRLVGEATLVACRRAGSVSLILACQGDRHLTPFAPTYFVNITDHWQAKVKMLEAYRDFLMPYPDPRSIEGQEARARYWGTVAGCEYAEAFELIRRTERG